MYNSKWQQWYDSLPEHTKIYLKNQPVWHDSDMWRAGIVGFVIGCLVGLLF